MRSILKKILSSVFNFYFALNFGHFHSFYKNVLIRDLSGIKHVCKTSEILIRNDIIFGLKLKHKTALPSIMLKCFTFFGQLHNKPRQRHRKSNFLWSNICPKWPKFTIRCHGNQFVLRGKWVFPCTSDKTHHISKFGGNRRCHVQPSLVAMYRDLKVSVYSLCGNSSQRIFHVRKWNCGTSSQIIVCVRKRNFKSRNILYVESLWFLMQESEVPGSAGPSPCVKAILAVLFSTVPSWRWPLSGFF